MQATDSENWHRSGGGKDEVVMANGVAVRDRVGVAVTSGEQGEGCWVFLKNLDETGSAGHLEFISVTNLFN